MGGGSNEREREGWRDVHAPTVDIPRLLTPRDIAEATGLPIGRVYSAAAAGLLPAVRIGRTVRFTARAVAEYLEAGGSRLPGGWRRTAPEPDAAPPKRAKRHRP